MFKHALPRPLPGDDNGGRVTRRYPSDALDLAGPTARELAAIDAEWPRRAADLAEVDREIAAILAADTPIELAETASGQGWFWTEEWQVGEREASAQIAAGGLTVYADMAVLFADMAGSRAALIGGTGEGTTAGPWAYLVEGAAFLAGGMPCQGKSAALCALALADAAQPVEGTEGGGVR